MSISCDSKGFPRPIEVINALYRAACRHLDIDHSFLLVAELPLTIQLVKASSLASGLTASIVALLKRSHRRLQSIH